MTSSSVHLFRCAEPFALRLLLGLGLLAFAPDGHAEKKRFRTDADGPVVIKRGKARQQDGAAEPPEWYQLVPGEFPPEGSAHAIPGELIQMDHLERRFQLRVDRNDSQPRGNWDLPVYARMLPYGAIYQHGAPAAIRDVPLGTHLHGLFYLQDPEDKTPLPIGPSNNRLTPEKDFRRCFQLEDDFSHHARRGELWRVEAVDLSGRKLKATLLANDEPQGDALEFDLMDWTRVLRGDGFADLKDIAKGQTVLFNRTWVTLYGPGRITDIWLDETSRRRATALQQARHRQHIRERGLPGWVTAVDDEARIVTINFFGNVDPVLFDELAVMDGKKADWPMKAQVDDPNAPKGAVAVARESLMTYDPVNDKKRGEILEIKRVPVEPGGGGVQLRIRCDLLLEGFRPHHIVRFFPATWPIISLPREEEFFNRE